jgi:two-component system, response regulator YesN
MDLRVLIAEDEPPTLRDLVSLVEVSPGVAIVGTAANGSQALDLLDRTPVDLVLTDVVMPVMDGLEFIRAARDRAPSTEYILVTGYDEFEYAREALRLGVTEYLLKPFSERTVRSIIRDAKHRATERKRRLLRRYLLPGGRDVSDPMIQPGVFTGEGFAQVALLALGWRQTSEIADPSVTSDSQTAERIERHLNTWLGPRREALVMRVDGDDLFVVLVFLDRRRDALSALLADAIYRAIGNPPSSFFTALVMPPTDDLCGLPNLVWRAVDSLDSAIAPYESAVRLVGQDEPPASGTTSLLDDPERTFLKQLFAGGEREAAAARIIRLFRLWVERRVPQADIERALRQIVVEAIDSMILTRNPAPVETEQRVILRLRGTRSVDEGVQALRESVDELFRLRANRFETRELVLNLEAYLRAHYTEPLDTQTLSLVFNRVPHYLSAVYKRSVGMSPTEHLSRIRISAACELMVSNPTLPLKDIAASIGFSDQAYFSRVFRSIAGCSPSEYRRSHV